jgi:hypothetical protein
MRRAVRAGIIVRAQRADAVIYRPLKLDVRNPYRRSRNSAAAERPFVLIGELLDVNRLDAGAFDLAFQARAGGSDLVRPSGPETAAPLVTVLLRLRFGRAPTRSRFHLPLSCRTARDSGLFVSRQARLEVLATGFLLPSNSRTRTVVSGGVGF